MQTNNWLSGQCLSSGSHILELLTFRGHKHACASACLGTGTQTSTLSTCCSSDRSLTANTHSWSWQQRPMGVWGKVSWPHLNWELFNFTSKVQRAPAHLKVGCGRADSSKKDQLGVAAQSMLQGHEARGIEVTGSCAIFISSALCPRAQGFRKQPRTRNTVGL